MSALPIFSELSDKGLRVRVDGSDLVLSPKKALTPNLASRIKKEKPALIQSLEEIKRKAGADWDEIANDPSQLKAFAELLMIGEMRHRSAAQFRFKPINCIVSFTSVIVRFPAENYIDIDVHRLRLPHNDGSTVLCCFNLVRHASGVVA